MKPKRNVSQQRWITPGKDHVFRNPARESVILYLRALSLGRCPDLLTMSIEEALALRSGRYSTRAFLCMMSSCRFGGRVFFSRRI